MEEEIEIDLIQKLLLGEDIQKLPPDVHKFFETYNILNKIIKKDLVFEHGTGTGIFFLNCIFEGSVRFEAKEFKSGIVACNCKFMKGIAFSDGDYSGSIEISSKVEKSITLSGGNYKRIELDCECEALSIGNCKVDGLYIQGTVSKRIRINHIQYNGIGFSGNIFFSEIIVDKLEFEWFLRKDSEIFIKGINVRELRISKFINDGKLRIFDLSALTINVNGEIANQAVSSDVYILDSYLGNAELYNINFKEFNKVIIRNSLLTGCSFINVIWPKDVLTNINENKTAKEVNNDKKEVYKQIKYALSKQGDNVTEQQFHGLEMNIYNKTLSFRNDFWTKIILYLSYFTSNYGQSFLRPVVTIIIINSVLFWLLYTVRGTIFNRYDFSRGDNYLNTVVEFIRISNPLHRNEPELKGLAFIIDAIIRVVSSYCIYNIIRATRRFVK